MRGQYGGLGACAVATVVLFLATAAAQQDYYEVDPETAELLDVSGEKREIRRVRKRGRGREREGVCKGG